MKESLIKNIETLQRSALMLFDTKDYTSATILYFKLSFALMDLVLFTDKGVTPKDHAERFRLLQKYYPEEYEFLDKYFQVYRDTYSLTISKENCMVIKNNVEKYIKKHKRYVDN